MKVKDEGLEVVVVSDGDLSVGSMHLCGKNEEWIYSILKKRSRTASRSVYSNGKHSRTLYAHSAGRQPKKGSEKMKRMAFSIILAVFAVAVCIFGYCNTARSANTLIVSAENIDRLLSDGEAEKALEESRKLQADWEKIHDKLCVFLPHEHLEPLENIFAVLPYYIEQEEVSLARAECQMVKNTAEHIQKTERIAFENVF